MAEWSSLEAMWRLREDRTLSHADWRVAVALVMFSNDTGTCWPSVAKLAATARTNKPGVRRSLRRMETGVGPIALSVQRGRGSGHGDQDTHHYVLRLREGWVQGDPTPVHPDPTPVQGDPGVGTERTRGGSRRIRGVGPGRSPKRIGEEEKEEDTEAVSAGAPLRLTTPRSSKQTQKRWRRVPASWQPNDEHRKLALEHSKPFDAELQKFRDHEFKDAKSDADAAFRNWIRSDYGGANGKRREVQGGAADVARIAERSAHIRKIRGGKSLLEDAE